MGSTMSAAVSALLNKFRTFFDSNLKDGVRRKRKSTEEETDARNLKYRRVTNEFPKFVTPVVLCDENNHYYSKNSKPARKSTGNMNNDLKKSQQTKSNYFGASASNKLLNYADIEFSDDDDDFEPKRLPAPRPIPPLEKINKIRSDVPKLNPIRKEQQRSTNHFSSAFSGGFGSESNSLTRKLNVIPTSSFYNRNDHMKKERQQSSIVDQHYDLQSKNDYRDLLEKLIPHMYNDNRSERSISSDIERSSSNLLNKDTISVIDITREGKPNRRRHSLVDLSRINDDVIETIDLVEPTIQPINTLKEKLQTNDKYHGDIVLSLTKRYYETGSARQNLIREEESKLKQLAEATKSQESQYERVVRDFTIKFETIVLDEDEEEEIIEYPQLTEHHLNIIKRSLYGGPRSDVLLSKFNLSITRNDLATLVGDSWLNDEVINFYMNLIMERSEKNDSLPKVYAMNTFFIPKLLQGGHSSVRRWTRKVDVFSYDVIPIPVHVGKVHWCMAIIHLKNKTIKYYDSMGTPNNQVLNALEQYLMEESLDKKKERFDTSSFKKENVRDCPKQMNGSDCGVFSCMFAEFISRNRPISFGQLQMPYFRNKMIFEIVQGKLIL